MNCFLEQPLPRSTASESAMQVHKFLVPALAVLLLPACVTLPQPLQAEVTDITPAQAREVGRPGLPVRWGGRIVKTEPLKDRTCFEMIGSALDADGRPSDMTDDGSGRFIACKAGFYDPAIFLKNREVTFVGRIDGFETRTIGEYDYRQPRVTADVIYLWPEARVVDVRYPAPRPWPWWGWDWYPGWW
jgi:outer membrane lipoprotein